MRHELRTHLLDLNTTIDEIAGEKTNKMEPIEIVEALNRIMSQIYDGEQTKLETFLGQITLAKTIVGNNHPEVFLAFIKSRLSGKALEAIIGVDDAPEANQSRITFIYDALKKKK